MADAFLRLKHVVSLTGVSRSTVYKWVAQGTFPKPLKLGERASAWRLSEVEAWMQSRIDRAKKSPRGARADVSFTRLG